MGKRIGSWLLKNGYEKVYMYGKNSVEWTLTEVAAWNYGNVLVPLYDTLGQEAFHHIVRLAEGKVLATFANLSQKLIDHLKIERGRIETIVIFDHPEKICKEDRERFK